MFYNLLHESSYVNEVEELADKLINVGEVNQLSKHTVSLSFARVKNIVLICDSTSRSDKFHS